jgi:adenosylcobinamide-phosphate synthase
MTPEPTWMILAAAVALDLAVGDPQGWPHPVRWMGMAIEALEPRARKLPVSLVAGGAVMTLGLVAAAWVATAGCLTALEWIHPMLRMAAEIVLIAWLVSLRSLYDAGMAVHRAFTKAGIAGARSAVAMIVGRETQHLDDAGVSRATVESVAENLVDGVVSPLFYAALGGAPLAMAFKMVNTLDSMIGYRNARYERFGKVAARLDDAANYLPARLSAPVIALAAWFLGGHFGESLRLVWKAGTHAASPNAGYPEAAFAGALNVRLGGSATYHGRLVDKPFIGADLADVDRADIPRACVLMLISGLLWMVAAMVIRWLA